MYNPQYVCEVFKRFVYILCAAYITKVRQANIFTLEIS